MKSLSKELIRKNFYFRPCTSSRTSSGTSSGTSVSQPATILTPLVTVPLAESKHGTLCLLLLLQLNVECKRLAVL